MGHDETQTADDARIRLIETARAMVLRGDAKFSIATLCTEANIERNQFRAHFSGKTALMAALMQEQASLPLPIAEIPSVQPVPEPQTPKAEQEPSVSTPDAWLERRLRVFERALNALEAKVEANAREHARVVARLEEKLAALSPDRAVPGQVLNTEEPVALQAMSVVSAPVDSAALEVVQNATNSASDDMSGLAQECKPACDALVIPPLPLSSISKEEMAGVLQSARDKARAAAAVSQHEQAPADKNIRMRWLAIGALSLVVLFLCIGFTLGNTASATQNDRMAQWQGAGISHRHLAQSALARTIASADFGDAKAEARLALAYLRGQGVARDASAALRWSKVAAQSGEPTAQYLLGALYEQGEAVRADPARAFTWFAIAAAKGNLKAMHNLAIAYAQGQGVQKDEAKATQWFARAADRGYVDSAFDLAVMYERGAGVPQDPRQALKWYSIAARAGDQPSKARAEFLREQMDADDVKLATDAAVQFEPLPALPSANTTL